MFGEKNLEVLEQWTCRELTDLPNEGVWSSTNFVYFSQIVAARLPAAQLVAPHCRPTPLLCIIKAQFLPKTPSDSDDKYMDSQERRDVAKLNKAL